MKFLDVDRLEALGVAADWSAEPYPWTNPEGLLFPRAFREGVATLPALSRFDPVFGKIRKHGQESHDRCGLGYRPELPLSAAWQRFLEALQGARYRAAMARLMGVRSVHLNFHGYFAPKGCSV